MRYGIFSFCCAAQETVENRIFSVRIPFRMYENLRKDVVFSFVFFFCSSRKNVESKFFLNDPSLCESASLRKLTLPQPKTAEVYELFSFRFVLSSRYKAEWDLQYWIRQRYSAQSFKYIFLLNFNGYLFLCSNIWKYCTSTHERKSENDEAKTSLTSTI